MFMKIAGIVAEYNPFHNGHADHITRTRDRFQGAGATHVVAVMSGAFVQRGEPALFPKPERVKAALLSGVDLVLELPVPWALSSAEGFAFGGVSVLNALGCVDVLSFGSECGDIDALNTAAEQMQDTQYLRLVRYRMEQGVSAPEAQQYALQQVGGTRSAKLLETPNNVLGLEYLKALRRLDSSITPFTVKRVGAGHDEPYPLDGTASASFIRRLARENRFANATPFIPREEVALLSDSLVAGRAPADAARMERALLLKLRSMSAEQLAGIAGVSEGLENRLLSAAAEVGTLSALLETVKTKRYPLTRLQRLVWSAALGIPRGITEQEPPYLRVLGMNERGREILNAARTTAQKPFLSRATQADSFSGFAHDVWTLECRAAEWYSLTVPTPLPRGSEYTDGIIKV